MKRKIYLSDILIFFCVGFRFFLHYKINEKFLLLLLAGIAFAAILDIFNTNRLTKNQLIRLIIVSVPFAIIGILAESPNFIFPIIIATISLNRDFKD